MWMLRSAHALPQPGMWAGGYDLKDLGESRWIFGSKAALNEQLYVVCYRGAIAQPNLSTNKA